LRVNLTREDILTREGRHKKIGDIFILSPREEEGKFHYVASFSIQNMLDRKGI